MKLPIYNLEGKHSGEIEVGQALSKPVRLDIINRCVLAEAASKRQAYGTDVRGGKRTSAHYHGERGYRFGMMNREMARLKRIHNQGYMTFVARFSPQARKGRQAHPPKAEAVWFQKVNKKEKLIALFSSISASTNKSLLSSRGHIISGINSFPLVIDDKADEINNTKKLRQLMISLGLEQELERVKEKNIRAGMGKNRGRKYKKKKGPIIVSSNEGGLAKSAKNIAGVDFSSSKKLSISMLAPGGQPGRLMIFTKSALEDIIKLSGK